MRIVLCLAAVAAILLAAPADVNVSGTWSGTMTASGPEAGGESSPALLVLKQAGAEITGTAGPNEGEQFPLTKGSIAGDKVTLEITPREGQVIKLALVLAGDKMTGELNMSRDGQSRTAKIEVSRAK